MKKVAAFMCFMVVVALVFSGCSMFKSKTNNDEKKKEENKQQQQQQQQQYKPKFNAQQTLGPRVLPNIKMYVDVSKAKVGQSATRKIATMTDTVAVVGEKDGKKLVELSGSTIKDYMSNTMCAIILQVEENGDVVKAWGGKIGEEAVELKVPAKPAAPKAGPATKGPKADVVDLDEIEMFGFKAKGKKVTTGQAVSSSWSCPDFPFFGGLLKSESVVAGNKSVIEVTEYKAEGAKCQVKLPGEKK